jgi:predicted acyltransferase
VVALAGLTGWSVLQSASGQMTHAPWNGFRAWDLVFPLFLFLAGVSFQFSLARARERGVSERQLRLQAVRRGLLLVVLGVIYNLGPHPDFAHPRFASVLGRIGLAWMFAALIAMRWRPRGQVVWVGVILIGYWLLLTRVPVPGQGGASLAPGKTLDDWLDRKLLPGTLYNHTHDPEGILATIPAIATALLGMLAGAVLRTPLGLRERVAALVGGGLVFVGLGAIWNEWFPINKNLWSSSFVLWTAGLSALLLALFHGAFDVAAGARRFAFPLVVIGANALTAYVAWQFLDLPDHFDRVLRGARLPADGTVAACAALCVLWLLLYALYRRRWFLRL